MRPGGAGRGDRRQEHRRHHDRDIYVRPPAGVDSCSPSCYPAQDFLRDKIASPNQASEYDWTNIDQNVGDLADQILAQLC